MQICGIEIGSGTDLGLACCCHNVANGICMFENDSDSDSYVVRVISLANAASLFTWELCRADGLVVQRSPKTFPTRIEALFGSAQSVAVLVLDAAGDLPLV